MRLECTALEHNTQALCMFCTLILNPDTLNPFSFVQSKVIRAKRQKHLTDVRREMDEFAEARAQAMSESRARADLYAPACVSSDEEDASFEDVAAVGGADGNFNTAATSSSKEVAGGGVGYIAIDESASGEPVASSSAVRADTTVDARRVSGPYDDDDDDGIGAGQRSETVPESTMLPAEVSAVDSMVTPVVSDE